MPENLNTNEYWEQRFKENWEERGGRMQTQLFAEMAVDLMPEWLKHELSSTSLSFCDAGCGMGDSYSTFVKVFPGLDYHGFDFSKQAVDSANETYPDASFKVNDLFNLDTSEAYDIVFCSNVLEHFEQPENIARELLNIAKKYLIVMVPFRERSSEPEHMVRFTTHNLPMYIDGFSLVYAGNKESPEPLIYSNRQILLIYVRDGIRQPLHYLSSVTENVTNDAMEIAEDETARAKDNAARINNEFYSYKVANENKLAMAEEKYEADIKAMEDELEQLRDHMMKQQQAYTTMEIQCKDAQIRAESLNAEIDRLNASWSLRIGYALLQPFRWIRRIGAKLGRMVVYLFNLDMKGMKFELVEPFARRMRPVITRRNKNAVLESISKDINGRTVLILPPTLDWEMKLFQRPQQLAMAYSEQPNMAVIYLTPNIDESILTGFKAKDNLWVLNWELYGDLLPYLSGAKRRILSISWTVNRSYYDRQPDAHLIYEYIDELEIFMSYGEQMEADHAVLAQLADVTVCTATKLYDQVKPIAKNPLLSTNGGDYGLFSTTRKTQPHPDMAALQKKYDKVLGYYGALAKWFDYDTVLQVAKMKPEWGWALVGLDYDGTLQKSGVLELPNVEYLGPQEYKTLPQYLTAFDIATIPFAINEITLSTSPVKLFEYMAGGKPILTSDLPECRKYESVYRYTSAEEFIEQAEKLFALQEEDSYWQALEREALANTWDAKVKEILAALDAD